MGKKRTSKKTNSSNTKTTSSISESDKLVADYFERLKNTKPAEKSQLPAKVNTQTMQVIRHGMEGDRLALARFRNGLSLDRILDEKCTQISACTRADQEGTDRLLRLMLVEFAQSFSLARNLTTAQIEELAVEIVATWWHLSFEDITLLLSRIKRGEYGEIWHLDVNKMLNFLRIYDEERIAVAAERRKVHDIDDAQRSSELSKDKDAKALAYHLTKLKHEPKKKNEKSAK